MVTAKILSRKYLVDTSFIFHVMVFKYIKHYVLANLFFSSRQNIPSFLNYISCDMVLIPSNISVTLPGMAPGLLTNLQKVLENDNQRGIQFSECDPTNAEWKTYLFLSQWQEWWCPLIGYVILVIMSGDPLILGLP